MKGQTCNISFISSLNTHLELIDYQLLLHMKLISFDIGIKNMAYCIFIVDGDTVKVQDWGVLNLMDECELPQKCTCKLAKKNADSNCNSKAKYVKDGQYYCETHMKKDMTLNNWRLRNKSNSPATIKKMKKDELIDCGNTYKVWKDTPTFSTKKGYCDAILEHLDAIGINPIIFRKKKTAGEVDLITIGRNMKTCLDNLRNVHNITHVIMENQISTIASRMKTIQGMLAQYYIMQPSLPQVEFVSSANKLKHLVISSERDTYKQHKKDSIEFCEKFLSSNQHLGNWGDILHTPKKDDLADAFLQGIWYLKHRKLITYADNLNINSVSLS